MNGLINRELKNNLYIYYNYIVMKLYNFFKLLFINMYTV